MRCPSQCTLEYGHEATTPFIYGIFYSRLYPPSVLFLPTPRSPLLRCKCFVINYSTGKRRNRALLFYRLPFHEKFVKIRSIFAVSFSLSSISVLFHFLHLSIYVLSSSVFLFFSLVAKNLVAAIYCCDERDTNDTVNGLLN